MLLTCFAVFQELKLMTWSISLFILIQMLNYPFQRRTFLPLIGKGRFYSHLEKLSLIACLFNKNLQTFVGWEISYEKIIPFNKRQGICSKISRSWIINIFFLRIQNYSDIRNWYLPCLYYYVKRLWNTMCQALYRK